MKPPYVYGADNQNVKVNVHPLWLVTGPTPEVFWACTELSIAEKMQAKVDAQAEGRAGHQPGLIFGPYNLQSSQARG